MLRPLKKKPLPGSRWWRVGLLGLVLAGCSTGQSGNSALRRMNLGPVEPYPPLNSFFRDRSTAAQQTAPIQACVRNHPNSGGLVMATHQVNITATGGVLGPGQAVVMALHEVGELTQVRLLGAGPAKLKKRKELSSFLG